MTPSMALIGSPAPNISTIARGGHIPLSFGLRSSMDCERAGTVGSAIVPLLLHLRVSCDNQMQDIRAKSPLFVRYVPPLLVQQPAPASVRNRSWDELEKATDASSHRWRCTATPDTVESAATRWPSPWKKGDIWRGSSPAARRATVATRPQRGLRWRAALACVHIVLHIRGEVDNPALAPAPAESRIARRTQWEPSLGRGRSRLCPYEALPPPRHPPDTAVLHILPAHWPHHPQRSRECPITNSSTSPRRMSSPPA